MTRKLVSRLTNSLKDVHDFFRMWVWAALGLAALAFLGRNEQVLVMIHKASLVFVAAFVGYWIDRNLFGAINHADRSASRTQARALIISAVILAFALGL